tara:strand:- start:15 stop:827 length:813 start_codon:yes stop_codon:yes gene_type:complete
MKKKKLFISNLAWEHRNFNLVKELIKINQFNGIDIAPIKISNNWKNLIKVSKKTSKDLRKEKIKVNAIQGIYFKKNFNIFKKKGKYIPNIYNHTVNILDICKIYKCKKIIIGSSEFRKKGKLNINAANTIFINFFKGFKKILNKKKIYLCLETIPYQYNEDFIFDFYHMLYLVKKINCKWIKINFDSSLFHFKKFDKNLLFKNLKYVENIQVTQKYFEYFLNPSKHNIKFCRSLKLSPNIKNISLEIISQKTDINKINYSMKNFKRLVQN